MKDKTLLFLLQYFMLPIISIIVGTIFKILGFDIWFMMIWMSISYYIFMGVDCAKRKISRKKA
jgi:hypothetical protein